MPITFSAIFFLMTFLTCDAMAASITETKAAIGEGCTASGSNSTAMGYYTAASGSNSTAMGGNTTASGDYSTAMGGGTFASGDLSTAIGWGTTAGGKYSTAIGYDISTYGKRSFVGGSRMNLTASAIGTFVWGHSGTNQEIEAPNAFLIFPAGISGKVGIGTKTPDNLLDLGDTLGKKLAVYQGPGGYDFYGFGISAYTLEIYAGAAAGDSPAMVVKDFGNVGIGTSDPGSYKLNVNGDVAGNSWTNHSSREFKEDIRQVDDAAHPIMLTKLMDMGLVTYKYKKEYGGDGETKLGFIAEDMPEEVLSKDGKGVDLYELLTLTIGAMKAQQKENEILKANLAEVLVRLEALEK